MTAAVDKLAEQVEARFKDALVRVPSITDELTYEVGADKLLETCRALRDEKAFRFEQLMDVCGVDYLGHGLDEWRTESSTRTGFSRGVRRGLPEAISRPERRYAAVYHLLSVSRNERLRLRVYCTGSEPPMVPSVIGIWASAAWFEREAFDLYGILFDGNPDLRRILTDYGFVGHPFRKDFPLSGNVEVKYDPEKKRVVYQPVSIEPRTLVPRVIRHDPRYDEAFKEVSKNA
ncbi:MAG TPA: NADH-quinone oxidoreductase subunit C [Gammaproteobacteria bacterium]|jgi:NADH-quinone oxidoreductase subunit C|nr:NADH-quinone oxidoreductase subunit C [Gammaproteobacteria bacterium]